MKLFPLRLMLEPKTPLTKHLGGPRMCLLIAFSPLFLKELEGTMSCEVGLIESRLSEKRVVSWIAKNWMQAGPAVVGWCASVLEPESKMVGTIPLEIWSDWSSRLSSIEEQQLTRTAVFLFVVGVGSNEERASRIVSNTFPPRVPCCTRQSPKRGRVETSKAPSWIWWVGRGIDVGYFARESLKHLLNAIGQRRNFWIA